MISFLVETYTSFHTNFIFKDKPLSHAADVVDQYEVFNNFTSSVGLGSKEAVYYVSENCRTPGEHRIESQSLFDALKRLFLLLSQ